MIIEYCVEKRYIILLIIFAVFVAGKLHGSSIAEWDRFLKERTPSYERPLLIGKARGLLSDEWMRQTPLYFSQAENKEFFPFINRNIRSEGQNMVITFFAPVFDITLLGKPFNWGFILFGKEYGLSWYWWSRLILLLLVSFELSSILTCNSFFLSVVCSLWITFSSYIQWGFAYQEVDLIIYFQTIVVVLWNYTRTTNKKMKLALVGILTMSIIGFILSFHPAFQISLGYLLIILILLFVCYLSKSGITFEKYDFILFFASFLIVGISLISFLSHSWEAIQLTSGTVFPGKRFSTGGRFNIHYFQLYLIDWLLPYQEIPVANAFEASTFLNFLPALFFVLPMILKSNDKVKYLWIALFSYNLFLCSWLLFPFPAWFAKYSLFSFVTEQRLHVVVGLIAVYLSILTFSFYLNNKPMSRIQSAIISVLITFIYYASVKYTPMITYLKSFNTVVTLLFFFCMNIFF